MTALIRFAKEEDDAQIAQIYAPYVRNTVISFELEEPTVQEMRERLKKITLKYPWLVWEQAGEILGYAYASTHGERAAYQWSVDVSVYLRESQHRRGIGRALYTVLFALLKEQGYYNAYAGIALPNPKSVGIHEALGFRPVGIYQNVGFKMGNWHDVGWWQLNLRPYNNAPVLPQRLDEIRAKLAQSEYAEIFKGGLVQEIRP